MKFLVALTVIVAVSYATQVEAENIFTSPIQAAKKAVDTILLDASATLHAALEKVDNAVDKLVSNVDAWAGEKRNEVIKNFESTLDKVDHKIDELRRLSEENGYDLAHCEEIAHQVQKNVLRVLDESVSCAVDRVHVVSNRLSSFRNKLHETVGQINQLLSANDECIKSSESTARKTTCVAWNNFKATYQITPKVASLAIESMKVTASAVVSPLPAGICITQKYISTTVEQTKSMFNEVQQCAHNQLNKLNNTSTTKNNNDYNTNMPESVTSTPLNN